MTLSKYDFCTALSAGIGGPKFAEESSTESSFGNATLSPIKEVSEFDSLDAASGMLNVGSVSLCPLRCDRYLDTLFLTPYSFSRLVAWGLSVTDDTFEVGSGLESNPIDVAAVVGVPLSFLLVGVKS